MPPRAKRGAALLLLAEHVDEPTPNGCRLWPYSTTKFGYGKVWIDGVCRDVHVVTCEAWHGPKPTPAHEAAHSCGNPACWAGEHLSWKTKLENEADKVAHGTVLRGDANPASRLTEQDVRKIRQRLEAGDQPSHIARDFGIHKQSVANIRDRVTWSWLD